MRKIIVLLPALVMIAIISLGINFANSISIYAQVPDGNVEVIEEPGDGEYGTTVHYCGGGQYTERCQHSGTGCVVGAQGLCN